ncbi:MAG: FAD:protein FMN transferase [Elusimicrobiota bacterium]
MKSNLNKKAGAIVLAALASALASARAAETHATRMRWLMGTFCQIEAWGPAPDAAVAAAFDEIDRWDRVLSLYKKESELNALNASAGRGPFHASADLYAATETAMKLAEKTGGAFDPTVLPVIRRGPEALPLVGWRKVRLDPAARTIDLPAQGMALDFGGIGKGWALELAARRMNERGVTRAFFNFGGQILAIGTPEDEDAWSVVVPGLTEPLRVRDESVSTSGDEERPGHIVSPFDGLPVHRKLNATAVLPSATEADAWSTALYVLGKTPPSFPGRAFFAAALPSAKGDPK